MPFVDVDAARTTFAHQCARCGVVRRGLALDATRGDLLIAHHEDGVTHPLAPLEAHVLAALPPQRVHLVVVCPGCGTSETHFDLGAAAETDTVGFPWRAQQQQLIRHARRILGVPLHVGAVGVGLGVGVDPALTPRAAVAPPDLSEGRGSVAAAPTGSGSAAAAAAVAPSPTEAAAATSPSQEQHAVPSAVPPPVVAGLADGLVGG